MTTKLEKLKALYDELNLWEEDGEELGDGVAFMFALVYPEDGPYLTFQSIIGTSSTDELVDLFIGILSSMDKNERAKAAVETAKGMLKLAEYLEEAGGPSLISDRSKDV